MEFNWLSFLHLKIHAQVTPSIYFLPYQVNYAPTLFFLDQQIKS